MGDLHGLLAAHSKVLYVLSPMKYSLMGQILDICSLEVRSKELTPSTQYEPESRNEYFNIAKATQRYFAFTKKNLNLFFAI